VREKGDDVNKTRIAPLLLKVSGEELAVVLDAIVVYAVECAKLGDESAAEVTIKLVEHVRSLQAIDFEASRQAQLAMGLGVSKGRPQG
jgi:hypothetical protein